MYEFLLTLRRWWRAVVDFLTGARRPPVTVENLLLQLDSWWPWRAARAARALRSFRDPDLVLALARILRRSSWGNVQREAIDSLAEIGGTEAWAVIVEVLDPENSRKYLSGRRCQAARALGRRGGEEALLPLCKALEKDAYSSVRAAAAAALGQLWMRGAVNALIAARRDVLELSRRFATRPDLAEAPGLGRLLEGVPQALSELRESARYGEEREVLDRVGRALCQTVEKGWETAAAEPAIIALSHLGDARAIPTLARALTRHSNDPNRPQTVRTALRRVVQHLAPAPDPADLQPLLQAAGVSDHTVQEAAVEGLCNLVAEFLGWSCEAATPPLIQLLRAPNPGVRLRAIQALSEVGDARALSALRAETHLFSNVATPELKAAATEAIAAIEARVGTFTGREISRAVPGADPVATERSLTRITPQGPESAEEVPERLTDAVTEEVAATAEEAVRREA